MPSFRNGDSGFRCFLLLVQDVLGDIDSWPSYVLKLIFIDEYDALNSTATVAFFYGNKVPLMDALRFYTLCNDHNPIMSIIHFTLLYRKWNLSPCPCTGQCACTYYNVQLKKMQRLRGSHYDSPSDIPLGIDATGHGQHIRDRIALAFN